MLIARPGAATELGPESGYGAAPEPEFLVGQTVGSGAG